MFWCSFFCVFCRHEIVKIETIVWLTRFLWCFVCGAWHLCGTTNVWLSLSCPLPQVSCSVRAFNKWIFPLRLRFVHDTGSYLPSVCSGWITAVRLLCLSAFVSAKYCCVVLSQQCFISSEVEVKTDSWRCLYVHTCKNTCTHEQNIMCKFQDTWSPILKAHKLLSDSELGLLPSTVMQYLEYIKMSTQTRRSRDQMCVVYCHSLNQQIFQLTAAVVQPGKKQHIQCF